MSMDGGPQGSWRQAVKDAVNGDEVPDGVRRALIALAVKGDISDKKVDRLLAMLYGLTGSIIMLAVSLISNLIFGAL